MLSELSITAPASKGTSDSKILLFREIEMSWYMFFGGFATILGCGAWVRSGRDTGMGWTASVLAGSTSILVAIFV